MKSMWLIFKTEMLIYLSKADIDVKILFGKVTHFIDPEIRKLLIMGLNENTKKHNRL